MITTANDTLGHQVRLESINSASSQARALVCELRDQINGDRYDGEWQSHAVFCALLRQLDTLTSAIWHLSHSEPEERGDVARIMALVEGEEECMPGLGPANQQQGKAGAAL